MFCAWHVLALTLPDVISPLLSVMSVARRAAGWATITTLIATHKAMTTPMDAVMAALPLHRTGDDL